MITDRVNPWYGIGESVCGNNNNIKSILQAVGMDWRVEPKEVWYGEPDLGLMQPSANHVANVRGNTGRLLGIVSNKYNIVQNEEAFSFLDYMIPLGLDIVKGGIINDKKVWLAGKLNSNIMNVGEDQVDTYLLFTNSHDGKGSIRICLTPIRVACQNALNLAFKNSFRSWSVSHVGDIQGKLHTVDQAIQNIEVYTKEFQKNGLILQDTHLTNLRVENLLVDLFPVETGSTEQKEKVILERRRTVRGIFYQAPDLGRGTAWDFVNAVSDYATHYLPSYNEQLYRTSNLNKVMKGHSLIDRAYRLVA